MVLAIFLFIIGLAALIGGAQLLVLGASQLAAILRVSSLIIGLTIVSFGTSAPEIAVCALAAWRGEGALVIGNVVGSNIFNVLLVLGISAVLSPLVVKKQLIRLDVPLMIVISLIFWAFAWKGAFFRWQGFLLLGGMFAYWFFAFYQLKREPQPKKTTPVRHSFWPQLVWLLLGIVLLAVGSDLIVRNANILARMFGISELFIGLTMVAIGTSLPELATTIMAVSKKEYDLVVGNVVGSNICNLLAVMGISTLLAPYQIYVPPPAITFHIPIMVVSAIACLPIFITGHKISRWEGVLFLFYYFLYICYFILHALDHPILPLFTTAFFFFILPLSVITLIIAFVRHVYRNH